MRTFMIMSAVTLRDDIVLEGLSDALRADLSQAVVDHFGDDNEVEAMELQVGELMSPDEFMAGLKMGAAIEEVQTQEPTDDEIAKRQAECDHEWAVGYTHCQRGCGKTWFAWRQEEANE